MVTAEDAVKLWKVQNKNGLMEIERLRSKDKQQLSEIEGLRSENERFRLERAKSAPQTHAAKYDDSALATLPLTITPTPALRKTRSEENVATVFEVLEKDLQTFDRQEGVLVDLGTDMRVGSSRELVRLKTATFQNIEGRTKLQVVKDDGQGNFEVDPAVPDYYLVLEAKYNLLVNDLMPKARYVRLTKPPDAPGAKKKKKIIFAGVIKK